MCHNALVVGKHGLATEPTGEQCDSCTRYLKDGLKALRQVPATVAGSKLGPGSSVRVTRGKFAGIVTEITEEAKDFPGFWWVKCGANKPMMLAEGQLELKK